MISNLLCLLLESAQVNQQSIEGNGNCYFLFYFTVKVEYLFLKDWMLVGSARELDSF